MSTSLFFSYTVEETYQEKQYKILHFILQLLLLREQICPLKLGFGSVLIKINITTID